MISSGLQRIFYFSWTIIKMNGLFLLFSFMGLLVLGVGPSAQAMSDLFQEFGLDYQEITVKKFFSRWKMNFKRSNLFFLSWFLFVGLTVYGLFLSIQFKGLIWLYIDFLFICILLFQQLFYAYLLIYQSTYELSFWNLLKLSGISLFMSFPVILKEVFLLISIVAISYYAKGLLLFASFSFYYIMQYYLTKGVRLKIDRKLG